ncbi:MAG: hypothetical protein ABJG78_17425 [Cyclobacteriaceae bacterium]
MRNFGFLFLIILLNGCSNDAVDENELSNQNSVLAFGFTEEDETVTGYIDDLTSTILIEYSDDTDLENLAVEITISENATIASGLDDMIDLSSEDFIVTVVAENGDERDYRISGYTKNLLSNPLGFNTGESWIFNGNGNTVGVDETDDGRNEFYVIKYEDGVSTDIQQTVIFNRDYSNKYILFIGDLTTEHVVEGSITRHPYFWGHQNGPFNFDNDPFEEVIQGDMRHQAGANVWEIVYDANILLDGVESVLFQMGQAGQVGDSWDGTKCKFRDIEVRVFETFEDSEVYVSNLYML